MLVIWSSLSWATDFHFGHFEKPELLEKLLQYQKKRGQSWERLGFFIDYNLYAAQTPIDAIPFAGARGGIHFAFITDFDSTLNLEHAPIIMVSPNNPAPIKVVANNLNEFFGLICTVGMAEFLDQPYHSEDEVEQRLEQWYFVDTVDKSGHPIYPTEIERLKRSREQMRTERHQKIELLTQEFGIKPIKNPYKYLLKVQKKRAKKAKVHTLDNLGLRLKSKELETLDTTNLDLVSLQKFISGSTPEERRLLYRNSTVLFDLTYKGDQKIKKLILHHLREDGYIREANNLSRR